MLRLFDDDQEVQARERDLKKQHVDIHRPCPRNLVDGARKMLRIPQNHLVNAVPLAVILRRDGADLSVHVFFQARPE